MQAKQVIKPLIFVELNEINFDMVSQYINTNLLTLPSLKKVLDGYFIRTSCEKQYHLLEPWIQWTSVHTGLSFSEHNIFRLGDIVKSGIIQMFERLESNGLSVGAISPMNAENNMTSPAYFIPDPWTKTSPDDSFWSSLLASLLSQAVNDNAQSKLSFKSLIFILLGLVRFAKIKHYPIYLKLALSSRRAPWRKALFLDLFLHDIHLSFLRNKKPDFSTLFLNSGAHIQHHYFFNAEPLKRECSLRNPVWYVKEHLDPIAELLVLYDLMVGEYLELSTELIIATGLSQRPYNRIEYYYRLKNHENFLNLIGINFKKVLPRMTRDFLIEFDSEISAQIAHDKLLSIRTIDDNVLLFGEIDNRGSSLFVTLTYPDEINEKNKIRGRDHSEILLAEHVVFVAIKNGMHQEEGFSFFSEKISKFAPKNKAHVKCLCDSIMDYFNIKP
jgi:hypothetical protein